jgi:hypothetical protein
MLNNFLAILAIGLLVWLLYRGIKNNPEAFSKVNLSKSFMAMGVLGLILICVVSFVVMLLRKS